MFGVSAGFSVQFVADPQGNIGVAISWYPIGPIFSAGAAAGYQAMITDAKIISDLTLWSASMSGSVGPVGVEGSSSSTANSLTLQFGPVLVLECQARAWGTRLFQFRLRVQSNEHHHQKAEDLSNYSSLRHLHCCNAL
jgi:hypothetical protein